MLVLGNGESRKKIDLEVSTEEKIGCNAIHRDLSVQHLICVDRRMVQEALASKHNFKIYTRADWVNNWNAPNILTVPEVPYEQKTRADKAFQWGSGPYAVLLATTISNDIKLVGFDLYSTTGTINNIYKGTKNYDKADKSPVDPSYWVHQISKVFQNNPKKKFTIFQTEDWILPESWIYPNVSLDNISNIV
tara:strand:- start:61 stop:633 length:573 start_codon:yes stop_codon:yes gene_type:complete